MTLLPKNLDHDHVSSVERMTLSKREYLLLLWASVVTIVIIVSYLLKNYPVKLGTHCQYADIKAENHPTALLSHYESKLFYSDIDLRNEKCTMIMLTYKRESILPDLLTHYCKSELLKKILVIWNDVDTEIPQSILSLSKSCETTLVFIKEKENKLTNRFKPRAEIETDCVFSIDDDRKVKDFHDLDFAFHVWQEFRQRLVGFERRTHTTNEYGSYYYALLNKSNRYLGYSIMLTGSCFLHKVYLQMYHDPNILQKGMLEFVNSDKNCEDISMNMMVAKFLRDIGMPQSSAMHVKSKGKVKNLDWVGTTVGGLQKDGLSVRPAHYIDRSQCVNTLVEKYFNGHMPLLYTSLSFSA